MREPFFPDGCLTFYTNLDTNIVYLSSLNLVDYLQD